MAVNAATSSYVNNASSSKGFSGLASGVDTESMVEQLLSGTQSKIDKQEGLKQQLQWKQEIYRNIIAQINAFQSKFFSYSSSTNIASSSFWNSLSVFANSSAFKATATTSAATGTSTISVRRLATKASLTSGMEVSGNLSGDLDADALKKLTDEQLDGDYTVKFKVGDTTVEADLKDIFVNEDGTGFTQRTTAQLDTAIQKKLQAAFDEAETGVKVTVSDGEVSIVSSGIGSAAKNVTVSSDSGALGLQRLGLTATTGTTKTSSKSNNIETVTYTLSSKVDAVPKLEFTVTLDDLKKTVSIDLRQVTDSDGNLDKDAFLAQMKAGLTKAHGAGQVNIKETADGGFTLEVSSGRQVTISGSDDAMAVLGMKSGASNRISLSSKLSDLNLGTPLRGDDYRFTINGEEFHFTGDTAIIDVMDVINRSDAGVRMVYRAQDDKFVLEAKESGAGKQIDLAQSEGNLLTALFGVGNGMTVGTTSSSRLPSYEPAATKGRTFAMPAEPDPDSEEEDAVKFKDPADVLLSDLIDSTDDQSVLDLLGDLGDISLADLKDNGYDYKIDADGNVTILQKVSGDTTLDDLGYTLGDLPGTTKLSELEDLTDGKIKFTGSVGNGFLILDGYYGETADPDTASTLAQLFGKGVALGREPGEFEIVEGQNAEVMIDGVITERSSNNFTVNGINYDVSDITGSYSDVKKAYVELTADELNGGYTDADGNHYDEADVVEIDGVPMAFLGYYIDENGNRVNDSDLVQVGDEMKKFTGTATTVTVKQDTDTIINALKEFIDEYNVLVKTLNDLLDEDTNYRDYAPLTSAQKAEMSEREIELWEQKAKEGLLHRDTTIQAFLQEMRTALYQKPAGASYALYELGIETGEWELKGQLSFTLDGEATLRNLLENDPTGVASLFTTINGLGTTLNDILKATASTSSGSPGTLVQIAGLKDSDTSSSIYNQLKKIDDKIEALKRQYEMEKTRYWNQFNTMEQMISNMNTQSAYLAQMMGYSY